MSSKAIGIVVFCTMNNECKPALDWWNPYIVHACEKCPWCSVYKKIIIWHLEWRGLGFVACTWWWPKLIGHKSCKFVWLHPSLLEFLVLLLLVLSWLQFPLVPLLLVASVVLLLIAWFVWQCSQGYSRQHGCFWRTQFTPVPHWPMWLASYQLAGVHTGRLTHACAHRYMYTHTHTNANLHSHMQMHIQTLKNWLLL